MRHGSRSIALVARAISPPAVDVTSYRVVCRGFRAGMILVAFSRFSAIDQHWTHNSDNLRETLGRCLEITGGATAVGTKVELWDCNGGASQTWVQQSNGSLQNPQCGLCLDDPGGNAPAPACNCRSTERMNTGLPTSSAQLAMIARLRAGAGSRLGDR
ncbi:MAG TPA: RICIN domain-containing protein [Actinocrinis sp.]|nr:RICIN domain-containing protein [Actinocrinis sp.]